MQSIGEFDEERPGGASPPRARLLQWRSTDGLKVLMAATGIMLVAFLGFHLLGYLGREALSGYSALLVREPTLLWVARLVLLASVIVHAGAAALLWNRALPPPHAAIHRVVAANLGAMANAGTHDGAGASLRSLGRSRS